MKSCPQASRWAVTRPRFRVASFRNLPFDEIAECVFGDTPTRKWRDKRRDRPEKHELTSSNGSFLWTIQPRSLADKERDCKMSSMWRAVVILPVLLVTAPSSSAQYAPPSSYAPAQTSVANIGYALDDWRRLRQSSGYSFADYARFVIAYPDWPDS